jgi:hypothetical protein
VGRNGFLSRKHFGELKTWSGIRESNSRLHLGKVAYYHYTNPARGGALRLPLYNTPATPRQGLAACYRSVNAICGASDAKRRTSAERKLPRSSPLQRCEWTSPRGISADVRQSARRGLDQCTRGRTSHRHGRRQSPASDDACAGGPGVCDWISLPFSFSQTMSPQALGICQVKRADASSELRVNSAMTAFRFNATSEHLKTSNEKSWEPSTSRMRRGRK